MIALVLGAPKSGWGTRIDGVTKAVNRLRQRLSGRRVPPNRRGDFASYRAGFSFGGGQTVRCSRAVCIKANDQTHTGTVLLRQR